MTLIRAARVAIAAILLGGTALGAAQAQPPFIPSGPRGVVAEPCPPPLSPPPEIAQAMRNPEAPPPPAVALINTG